MDVMKPEVEGDILFHIADNLFEFPPQKLKHNYLLKKKLVAAYLQIFQSLFLKITMYLSKIITQIN